MKRQLFMRFFFVLTVLAFVQLPSGYAYASKDGTLSVSNAWIRQMPTGFHASAAYMILKNNGDESVIIDRAESERFGRIEIHDHIEENGVMRMRPIDKVTILPSKMVEFKPGGKHLMLYEFKEELTLGEHEKIFLFQGDKAVGEVSAEIRRQGF